jgi:iron complex transport system substrate-binding protein
LAALTLAAAAIWLIRPPDARFLVGAPLMRTQVIGDVFPKHLIDPIGRETVLGQPPRRIVSAVLAGDEMLAALVAPERIASVTFYADNPAISAAAGVFPSSTNRNHGRIEELLAQQPDLAVVASYNDAVTVRLLLKTGVAVVRLPDARSFADIVSGIQTLGSAVGAADRAAAVVANMQTRIAAVRRRVAGRARPRVLYYALGGFTVGRGSLIDEMIALAGGRNVAREAGVAAHGRISAELAIALQPAVLLVSGWQDEQAPAAMMLTEQPAWQQVPAVQDGRIHVVRGAWLTSVSQDSIRGVEVIARLLHPDAFDGED